MSPADIQRRVVALGDLPLANGQTLPDIHLAFETFGTLNTAGDNAVLVLHALTGDAHVTGSSCATTDQYADLAARTVHPFDATLDVDNTYPSSDPGWWSEVIGPGLAIDTNRYFVVAPNILGGCYGSTGPASLAPDGKIWGSRFPQLSTGDQVAAEHRLAEALGIQRWTLVIGASLGGQRALEWGVAYPDQVERLVIVASGAQTTAEQAAWIHVQLQAITSDPAWQNGDYSRGLPSRPPVHVPAIVRGAAEPAKRKTSKAKTNADTVLDTDLVPRNAAQANLVKTQATSTSAVSLEGKTIGLNPNHATPSTLYQKAEHSTETGESLAKDQENQATDHSFGGPTAGLALARQIAHVTYRCPGELDARFGLQPQAGEDPSRGGRFAVQSYLDHAGDKLVARFDAGSYVALSQTMLTFDVGAGRGGVDQALAGIRARTLAIAVDSDRLFFPAQSIQIASGVPQGHYREVHSAHGHDGFLIESDQLNRILKAFLADPVCARVQA